MSGRSHVVEAAVLLALTRVLFAVSPRRGAAEVLRRASVDQPAKGPAPRRELEQVARGIARASRWVRETTCLGRAVTGWAMLRRRGVRSVVRLGAQREASAMKMHAWLEIDGVPLIGSEEAAGFVPLRQNR